MPESETSVCNMALGRIGAKRINDFSDASATKPEAIQCRLHYPQSRDALEQSHPWRFCSARAELSEDTNTPAFEWSHQFHLPSDYLRRTSIFEDNLLPAQNTIHSSALEGNLLLTDDSAVSLRYIKRVTDVAKFDPLFIEVLVLTLAIKFVMPLSQDRVLYQELKEELANDVMPKVRAMARQELNTIGRADLRLWNDARVTLGGRIDSQLGSA